MAETKIVGEEMLEEGQAAIQEPTTLPTLEVSPEELVSSR